MLAHRLSTVHPDSTMPCVSSKRDDKHVRVCARTWFMDSMMPFIKSVHTDKYV